MKKYLNDNKLNIVYSLAALILMWLAWVIAHLIVKNEYVVPSFAQTCADLLALLSSGSFWLAFFNTLLRVLIAFAVSFALGLLCSVLGALIKRFNALLSPIISVLRTLPTMAVILIILIWTNPLVAPVIVTALVLFPMIYSQLNAAIGGVDTGLLQMAKVYGFSRRTRLTKIYLPLISPYVLSQTGANLSFAIKLTVSAEVMCYTYVSIGGMMQEANGYLQVSVLAALTLVAVLAGIVIEAVFHLISGLAFKWNRVEGGNED